MQPDYIQLNDLAGKAAEDVQRQINAQIAEGSALKEVLNGSGHDVAHHAGGILAGHAAQHAAAPVCAVLGNTVGAGVGGTVGAGVGMIFPAVELPAIMVGAQVGKVAVNYGCNFTAQVFGHMAWGKAYQARTDAKLTQAKEELSSHYERIHTKNLQQLINGKDATTQAYLQDQYYRSIKQQPFYTVLPDAKKNAIDQERAIHRATLTAQNANFQATATQHDAIDTVTQNHIKRVTTILNSAETNSPPPSPKMIAENQAFLKEFKAENAQMNAQTHRMLNAVLHEEKIFNKELKKLNAHNDEQAKKENALAQYKGMEAGFNVIGQIGLATGNQTVAKIGSVGAAGVSIAANVAMLSGAIPGVALSGWGLMIPYAGIALAGLSIISTLFGKKKSKNDPTLQALRALSEQIESFRQEMHQLIRDLSQEIKDEFLAQEVLIIKLNNLIKVMLSDGFDTINFKLDEIQGDLQRLTRLTNKGHSALYLQDFIRTVDAISDYVQVDGNRERELEKELITLHSWMSNPERIANTNAHWALADNLTAANAFDHAHLKDHHTLLGDTALSLGYLSQLSSLIPFVRFDGVQLNAIPNVGLFIEGIETYIKGRRKMGAPAAHVMDPQNKHLLEIKDRAENALKWMTQLRTHEHQVLWGLKNVYSNRCDLMSNAMRSAGVNRLETGLLTGFETSTRDALDMTLTWPQTMTCTTAGYHPLSFEKLRAHIQQNHQALKINQLVQNAMKKFGVGTIVAYYTPVFTPARENCVDVGDWTNNNNVIGRTAGYQITIQYDCDEQKTVLYTVNASQHEADSGVTPFRKKPKHGGQCQQNYIYINQAAAKNAYSRPDFFRDFWPGATLTAITDQTQQPLTDPLIHATSTAIMEKVMAAPRWPDNAMVVLNAIKAHPELLGTLPDEFTYLRGLMVRYATLLGHPALQNILGLYDSSQFFEHADILNHLIAHVSQNLAPQLLAARTGDAVPTHPIEQQFKYVIAWVDYLIAYEAQALLNQRNDLVNELQVDEAVVFDPNRIGNNQIVDANLLGRGSFGQVYRVNDGDQTLAVKVFYPGAGLDASARREIEVASRLNQADSASDFIVKILGATRIPDRGNALVMEYVNNGTLEAHLHEREVRLPVEHEMRITQEMVQGLKYLHDHNIIHNDFKSANVLLTEDYHVKISDYGISRVIGATQRSTTRRQTTTSQMSTLAYRAPELVYDARRQPDQKSDIYSLAVVLWELISRCRPYHETDGQDITILSVLMGLKSTPETANDHLSSALVTPLANLMRDASKRVPEQRIEMDEITRRLNI